MIAFPKSKPLRSKKITTSAKGQDCTLRFYGVCNYNPETTVFAHAPCVDKGMGFKSPDWWGMYACSSCHDLIDGRISDAYLKPIIPNRILHAVYETQKKLFELKIIEVK